MYTPWVIILKSQPFYILQRVSGWKIIAFINFFKIMLCFRQKRKVIHSLKEKYLNKHNVVWMWKQHSYMRKRFLYPSYRRPTWGGLLIIHPLERLLTPSNILCFISVKFTHLQKVQIFLTLVILKIFNTSK